MSEHATMQAAAVSTEARRQESVTVGMWIFLATEVLLFGGMFTAFMVYRLGYAQGFQEAGQHLDVALGSINTAVLLTSSLCMALAVQAAQAVRLRRTLLFLGLTIVLGIVFLGIKGVEYSHEIQANLLPGPSFVFEGTAPRQAQLFFDFYFIMTAIHAIHLTIGIGVVGGLALYLRLRQPELAARVTQVEVVGLYWHFVDIVWVFLFPLLYLVS